jgi:oligopeptide/dipeptide ABC transporter ATP-binding protein
LVLQQIPLRGEPPDPRHPPQGCRFSARCPEAVPECREFEPELRAWEKGHAAACLLLGEDV